MFVVRVKFRAALLENEMPIKGTFSYAAHLPKSERERDLKKKKLINCEKICVGNRVNIKNKQVHFDAPYLLFTYVYLYKLLSIIIWQNC